VFLLQTSEEHSCPYPERKLFFAGMACCGLSHGCCVHVYPLSARRVPPVPRKGGLLLSVAGAFRGAKIFVRFPTDWRFFTGLVAGLFYYKQRPLRSLIRLSIFFFQVLSFLYRSRRPLTRLARDSPFSPVVTLSNVNMTPPPPSFIV